MSKIYFSILFSVLLLTQSVSAQNTLSKDERMEWWREARFGMFIHWGVYAQFAGVYKGHEQRKSGAEWIMNRCKIPVAEYQEMAKSFNPIKYDADAWVKMAKDAGMKYLVITTKHHDGFALFKTNASKWNVVDATPYGKDLIAPLVAACRKYGLKLGFYYSQSQDWVNPGGATARKLMNEGWPNPDSTKIDAYMSSNNGGWDAVQKTKTFDQYVTDVAIPQVKELLTNYGDVSVFWWDTPMSITDAQATKLQDVLKLQPNIITNDRLKRPNFFGDTKTPEQKIPTVDELDGQDWETCMTMNGTWGFRTSDTNWKSSETLIRNLIDISSKEGNYLLNVGPKADGSFPQASIDRLKDISEWMKVNSEAIYSTKASPIEPVVWGRCTRKDSKKGTTLYLSVFEWPKDGKLLIPKFGNSVVSARLLAGNRKLKTSLDKAKGLTISVPATAPDKVASVIKIDVKGKMETRFSDATKKMKSGALD